MTESSIPWERAALEAKLREVGARAYHDKHPFHIAMNEGRPFTRGR